MRRNFVLTKDSRALCSISFSRLLSGNKVARKERSRQQQEDVKISFEVKCCVESIHIICWINVDIQLTHSLQKNLGHVGQKMRVSCSIALFYKV